MQLSVLGIFEGLAIAIQEKGGNQGRVGSSFSNGLLTVANRRFMEVNDSSDCLALKMKKRLCYCMYYQVPPNCVDFNLVFIHM